VDAIYVLFFLVLGLLPLIAAVLVMIAGARRLMGRRSRLDRLADVIASAMSQMVYPPSLRGGGPVVPPPPDEAE
jgi:hypothetical protein